MAISCSILDGNSREIEPKRANEGGTICQHFAYCLQETIGLFNGGDKFKKPFEARLGKSTDKIGYATLTNEDAMKNALFFFFLGMGEDKRQKGFPAIKDSIKNLRENHSLDNKAAFENMEILVNNLMVVSSNPKSIAASYMYGFFMKVIMNQTEDIQISKNLLEFKEFLSEMNIEGIKKVVISGELEEAYIEEKEWEKFPQNKLFFDTTPEISSELSTLVEKHNYQEEMKKNGPKKALEKLLRNLANKGNDEDLEILLKYKHLFDIDAQDDNPKTRKTAFHYAINHPKCYTLLSKAEARTDIPDAKGLKVKTVTQVFKNLQ